MTPFLRPGVNILSVAVANTGEQANPAGWIGAFDLTYQDGTQTVVKTDGLWSAGIKAAEGWEQVASRPDDWKPAQILGAFGMAPWNLRGGVENSLAPLYPAYDLTAALLKGMGVVEDFTATGPIRYGHRRTNDRDIYFVSNKTAGPVQADCRFRVGQGSPQLWDPLTGEQRPLPQFTHAGGLTTLPMEFAAFQSFFVVFDGKSETSAATEGSNFPNVKSGQDLSGAWEVAFDPKWGGPEKITFDSLQDWTARPEPGIKYYSGIATYRKVFDFAPEVSKTNTGLRPPTFDFFLDLGVVRDMARVKLNGRDLGVVWCAPWRVEVTGALKAGENQLEIEVVNRWANRLIGDKQPGDANARIVECPPGFLGGKKLKTGRYTFSTHDPYNAKSPLESSGLIGPVTLMHSR